MFDCLLRNAQNSLESFVSENAQTNEVYIMTLVASSIQSQILFGMMAPLGPPNVTAMVLWKCAVECPGQEGD